MCAKQERAGQYRDGGPARKKVESFRERTAGVTSSAIPSLILTAGSSVDASRAATARAGDKATDAAAVDASVRCDSKLLLLRVPQKKDWKPSAGMTSWRRGSV